jgi:glycerol-3-phosphate O-acyltransferase
VGINYDRTIEDRSLLRSLNPDSQRRSFWFVLRTTTMFALRNLLLMILSRWRRYGYACVNFGTPLSVKAYCRETGTVFSRLDRKARFPEVERLSRRLMESVSAVIPVLPVSLVSTVFLDQPVAEMDLLRIEQLANRLIDELQRNQAPILDTPRSTRMAAIADAVDLLRLRGLITESDGRFTASPHEMPLLRYYANAIVHWLPDRNWD